MSDRREKYSVKQRITAITLFRKGLSLRSIAEVIGANNIIVLYWIRSIGEFIKDTVLASAVQSSKDLEFVEIDELWHYVQKKEKKLWVWLAYSRARKRIIACEIGSRGVKTLKKLWQKLSLFKPDIVCTDNYKVYAKVIPNDIFGTK